MTLPRFYVPGSIAPGRVLTLPVASGHHLARVLRLSAGDEMVVFNGESGEYRCHVARVGKTCVDVMPLAFDRVNRNPPLDVHLGLSVLKKDAMDSAIARAVELGARSITPIVSDHCAVAGRVIRRRCNHWRQVAIAACEQCGLNLVPPVGEAHSLDGWLGQAAGRPGLIATPNGRALDSTRRNLRELGLLTGPEGGFSRRERDAAAGAGFIPVAFGARTLRAETAPLVALSVIHRTWGDF